MKNAVIYLLMTTSALLSCTTKVAQPDMREPAQITTEAVNNDIQFQLMHTKLNCKYFGYQSTFCEMSNDTAELEASAGMVSKINAQLDRALKDPSKSQVFIAYFSFSNKKVHTKLCELLSKKVSLRIFLDRGSAANIDVLKSNPACANVDLNSPQSRLKVSYLGGLTGEPWRLHHNKFLYVNPGTFVDAATGDKANINYSSGNLSSFGTSLHLDHWVTAVAPKQSNLIKAYQCVMESLESAVGKNYDYSSLTPNNQPNTPDAVFHSSENDEDVAQSYIQARERCYSRIGVIPTLNTEQAIAKEKIAPMFAPNNDNVVIRTFTSEAKNVPKNGYIYVAIQHFLNNDIGNALVSAAKRGVDVRVIMDDDVATNKGEVEGVLDFLNKLKAKSPAIKVRYIESNHLAGGNGSMMHNKFAIMNGKRVLSGAGQYTTAGMKNNWENFGLTEVPSLTRQYAEYFKELWDISVDEKYVLAQLDKNEAFQELSASDLSKAGLSASQIASYTRADGRILGTLVPQAKRTQPETLHPSLLK